VRRSWRAPRPFVLESADAVAHQALFRRPGEIDLAVVVAAHGGVLVHGRLDRGEGAMLRTPAGAVLTVDERLEGTPHGLFIAAHEAGHLVLHPDVGLSAWCRVVSGSFFQREIDASDFGSRVLTPGPLVEAWLRAAEATLGAHGLTLHVARAFADVFRVSLPVALLRLVARVEEPLAAVCTREGVVRWWSATNAFPFDLTMRFALGRAAHARTSEALARHVAHGEPELVPAEAWTKHRRARGATLVEHSVRFEGGAPADGALTLLRARAG
jgi:hypothetical protein